jgi:diguanylate cyclase (GGDEF)-like protein
MAAAREFMAARPPSAGSWEPADRPVVLVAARERPVVADVLSALAADGFAVSVCDPADTTAAVRRHRPALVVLSASGDAADLVESVRSDWRSQQPAILALADPDGEAPAGSASGADRSGWLSGAGGADAVDSVAFDVADPASFLRRARSVIEAAEVLRGLSPLTGLPGNTAIEREIRRRVAAGSAIALLYADLDHFKAFNDRYGFLQGDRLLRAVADAFRAVVNEHPGTFLGHVGGDDFVMVAPADSAERLAEAAVAEAQRLIAGCYDPADARRGWIVVTDRRGRRRRQPLASLSIGVATNRSMPTDYHRLVDAATEMKRQAKRVEGPAVAVDRRVGAWPARPVIRRWDGWLPTRPRLSLLFAACLSVIALAGSSAVALATVAQPGERLWPLKLGIEDLRLATADDPAVRAGLHLELAARRLGELVALDEDAPPALAERLTGELVRHVDAATALLAGEDASRQPIIPGRLATLARLAVDECPPSSAACRRLEELAEPVPDETGEALGRGAKLPGGRLESGPPSGPSPRPPPHERSDPAAPPRAGDPAGAQAPAVDTAPGGERPARAGTGQTEQGRPAHPDGGQPQPADPAPARRPEAPGPSASQPPAAADAPGLQNSPEERGRPTTEEG